MLKSTERNLFSLMLAMVLSIVAIAQDQPSKQVAAPIPVQITAARKVFIANAGGESNPYAAFGYSGSPDRAYNEFYAAMKSWGRYELVPAPAAADLVLEIQFTASQASADAKPGTDDPQFRLTIRDPRTNTLLWTITETFGIRSSAGKS
jgi:hypothetical protein